TTSSSPSRPGRSRRTASWRSTAAKRKAPSASRWNGPPSRSTRSLSARWPSTCRRSPARCRPPRRRLRRCPPPSRLRRCPRPSRLLQPPLRGRRVLAIDPGFRTGCKLAALDEYGTLLEHSVIYPFGGGPRERKGGRDKKQAAAQAAPPATPAAKPAPAADTAL